MRRMVTAMAFVVATTVVNLTASAATVVVEMQQIGPDFEFVPDQLVVHQGDVVEWRNTTGVTHTTTSGTGAADPQSGIRWDSGNMGPGATFQHTFTLLGTFDYYCVPHELAGMKGKITVIAEVPSTDSYGKAGLLVLLLLLGAAILWKRRLAFTREG